MSVSEFGFLHINPLCRCELDISAQAGTEKTERRIWAGEGGEGLSHRVERVGRGGFREGRGRVMQNERLKEGHRKGEGEVGGGTEGGYAPLCGLMPDEKTHDKKKKIEFKKLNTREKKKKKSTQIQSY